MPVKPPLLALLRCPETKGTLEYVAADSEYGECLYCRASARVYPVRDDLAVMMISEATALNPSEAAALQQRIKASGKSAERS